MLMFTAWADLAEAVRGDGVLADRALMGCRGRR